MFLKNNDIAKKKEYLVNVNKEKLFDIYFKESFINLHTNNKNRIYHFIFNENENYLLMPLIISPIFQDINTNAFYFETVYGYSGPTSSTTDQNFLNKAWSSFYDDCKKANIISGLIRFNPFLENHLITKNQKFIKLVKEKKIIYSIMSEDYEYYYNKFSTNVKKNIKNANNLDLQIKYSINKKKINDFKRIYTQLMDNKKADIQYYFTNEYFDKLLYDHPNNIGMISAFHKDKFIGAILYLHFNSKIHIHLSAVDNEYRKKGISYVLRSQIFKLFEKTNYIVNFGGGLGNSENDNLFKFKYGFSDRTKDYYIGKVTIDFDRHKSYKDMTTQKFGSRYKNMHMPYSFYNNL